MFLLNDRFALIVKCVKFNSYATMVKLLQAYSFRPVVNNGKMLILCGCYKVLFQTFVETIVRKIARFVGQSKKILTHNSMQNSVTTQKRLRNVAKCNSKNSKFQLK